MRLRLPAIKPLLVAAGLLLAAACGAELYLRIREPAPGDIASSSRADDGLTEPSHVVHHRLRPLSVFRSRDPDTGEAIEIVTDSHGLRGTEAEVPKPAGVFRVLCLGGETVLGPALPEPHTLPARLQELLQPRTRLRVEVLNGGVPDDCPLLAWLRLRDSLLALQPDLILLHFDMSDVADDQRHRRHTRVDVSGTAIACPHPAIRVPSHRVWWQDLRLTGLAVGLAGALAPSGDAGAGVHDSRAATLWLRDNPPDWGLYIEQALGPVNDVRRMADGTQAALVLSTCPQPWQVSAEASDGPGVRMAAGIASGTVLTSPAPFGAVAAFARERDIRCCDASPAFLEYPEGPKLFFRNSPQLSRYGQELYARVLSEFVATALPAFAAENGSIGSPEDEPAGGRVSAATAARPREPARYQ